jgi:hypothetical protein
LFALLSVSCATLSGAQSGADGPLLAPVSSAEVKKVTRCQTAADCGAPPSTSVGYACHQRMCELVSTSRLADAIPAERAPADPDAQAQAADATEITTPDATAKPADADADVDAPADAPTTPVATPPADPSAPATQPGDTTAIDHPIKDEAEPYPDPAPRS